MTSSKENFVETHKQNKAILEIENKQQIRKKNG